MKATVPGTETYRERKVARTFVPGSERAGPFRSMERKFQGAKWPRSELARQRKSQGANGPGSYWPIRSGERIGPGAKRLGTVFGLRTLAKSLGSV